MQQQQYSGYAHNTRSQRCDANESQSQVQSSSEEALGHDGRGNVRANQKRRLTKVSQASVSGASAENAHSRFQSTRQGAVMLAQ